MHHLHFQTTFQKTLNTEQLSKCTVIHQWGTMVKFVSLNIKCLSLLKQTKDVQTSAQDQKRKHMISESLLI